MVDRKEPGLRAHVPVAGYGAGEQIRVDGKQFAVGGGRFRFRGVTYGTFRPREEDGARFPLREQMKWDFAAMAEAGFTVVRTYTEPPDDLLDLAADWGLRVAAGIFWPDWRYLLGASRREATQIARDARAEVRRVARRLCGAEQVLGLVVGNEIPADVLRWTGTDRVAAVIEQLVETVKEEDPSRLVTYANYPTTEYLPLESVDFLTFNLFLEREEDFRRYLTRLQHLAGDRPLVLGEMGLHAAPGPDGAQRQAEVLDWQQRVALERGVAGTCIFSWTDEWWVGDAPVEGWRFGLTDAERSPRPALDVASRWNRSTVADLNDDWPSLSVVICAYNAEATLEQCLEHTCALDYPGLEVIVVDDGSADRTAAIASRYARVRLLRTSRGGLSAARNEGFRAADGDVIAYLDADAYPPPEWPYYLVLGFDGRHVAGTGGPNVPPPDDPPGAQVVARAPGGPVHVLTADDRAEHVPGCNMAFWRYALEEIGGFDPVYTAAGDDVDLCWKILDRGWEIGFHPAALIWHRRRPGLRPYLRQQRGYGRAEALVEARHPDRFGPIGTARWHGRIYNSLVGTGGRQQIYRGAFGTAAYQSVYQQTRHGLDIAHQVGVPLAAAALPTAPLAVVALPFGVPAVAAALLLATLFVVDTVRARPPRSLGRGRWGFRGAVGLHHLLQPLVRWWGRRRSIRAAFRTCPGATRAPAPHRRVARGTLLFPDAVPRAELAASAMRVLRAGGLRAAPASEWDDYDALVFASRLVRGELVTSSHPIGAVQLRVRRRLAVSRMAALVVGAALLASVHSAWGLLLAIGCAADLGWGWWRTGPIARRMIERGARK